MNKNMRTGDPEVDKFLVVAEHTVAKLVRENGGRSTIWGIEYEELKSIAYMEALVFIRERKNKGKTPEVSVAYVGVRNRVLDHLDKAKKHHVLVNSPDLLKRAAMGWQPTLTVKDVKTKLTKYLRGEKVDDSSLIQAYENLKMNKKALLLKVLLHPEEATKSEASQIYKYLNEILDKLLLSQGLQDKMNAIKPTKETKA